MSSITINKTQSFNVESNSKKTLAEFMDNWMPMAFQHLEIKDREAMLKEAYKAIQHAAGIQEPPANDKPAVAKPVEKVATDTKEPKGDKTTEKPEK